MPFIALPFKLTCVSVRLCVCCRRVGNAYELVGNELGARCFISVTARQPRGLTMALEAAAEVVAAVAAAAVAGCCCSAVRGGVSSGEP